MAGMIAVVQFDWIAFYKVSGFFNFGLNPTWSLSKRFTPDPSEISYQIMQCWIRDMTEFNDFSGYSSKMILSREVPSG